MQCGQELTMRTIREVLRLGLTSNLSLRDIARSLRVTHPTVQKYLFAAKSAALNWQQITTMNDEQLRQVITPRQPAEPTRPMPDCAYIHQELKKPGVTFALLWQEYKEVNPDGYQETQYRNIYHKFANTLRISLRQVHKFGDALFVDYAGHTIPIYDRITGSVSEAQIFVAVLAVC